MSATRIAIFGGDHRAERAPWPEGYDLRFFQGTRKGGQQELKRLKKACASGAVACIVWLSRWNGGSGAISYVKSLNVPLVVWDQGIGQLTKALPEIAAAKGIRPAVVEELKEETKEEIFVPEPVLETISETEKVVEVVRELSQPVVEMTSQPVTEIKKRTLRSWSKEEDEILRLGMQKNLRSADLFKFFKYRFPNTKRTQMSLLKQRQRLLGTEKREIVSVSVSVPGIVKNTEEEWLSQSVLAERLNIRRTLIYSGYAQGKIRRQEKLEKGVWLYSVKDAVMYVQELRQAGIDLQYSFLEKKRVDPTFWSLKEKTPEWVTWWEAHDDGTEPIVDLSKKLGLSRERIQDVRKIRGILRKLGKWSKRPKHEHVSVPVLEKNEVLQKEVFSEVGLVSQTETNAKTTEKTVILSELVANISANSDRTWIEMIQATGVLYDTGVLSAVEALSLLRKKANEGVSK